MGIKSEFDNAPITTTAAAAGLLVILGTVIFAIKGWLDGMPVWAKITMCCAGITYIAGLVGFLLHRLIPVKIAVAGVTGGQFDLSLFHGKFIRSGKSDTVYFVKHGTRHPLIHWEYATANGCVGATEYVIPKEMTRAFQRGSDIDSAAEMKALLADI